MGKGTLVDNMLHLHPFLLPSLDGIGALCLVDGEHYPDVSRWGIEKLQQEGANVEGVVFLDGTKKVGDVKRELSRIPGTPRVFYPQGEEFDYLKSIESALKETSAQLVVDLSDEPIIDRETRLEIASRLSQLGVSYLGADFLFTPPSRVEFAKKPCLGLVGTGKRIGKTAVSTAISRILEEKGIHPIVVSMGRGGPAEPEVIRPNSAKLSPEALLDLAEERPHLSSNYLEGALFSQVTNIGCRRCGGGMMGVPLSSNLRAGLKLAQGMEGDLVILEGSGSTFPPVRTAGKIVVVGAHQNLDDLLTGYKRFGFLDADFVVMTMCERPMADEEKVERLSREIRLLNPEVRIARTTFRPQPLGEIENKKVFLATTAQQRAMPTIIDRLEKDYGPRVVASSNNLANRVLLKGELERELPKCDVLLTEVKAASMAVAVRVAQRIGIDVVFLRHVPHLTDDGADSFPDQILDFYESALKEGGEKS